MHWGVRERWVMVVVAIIGFFLGLERFAAVARRRENAAQFRTLAAQFRAQAADPSAHPSVSAGYLRDAAQMEEIAGRYDRAARRPWSFSEPKSVFPR